MKTGHAKVNSEVDMRINEAEVCRNMGLFDESLSIYEQVLSNIPDTEDVEKVETIKARIDEIHQEISDREQTDKKQVSAQNISMVKKTLSGQNSENDALSGQTVLDSAASFRELGLFNEAITEYEKLIVQGHPPETIATDFTDCLLKVNSPVKLVGYISQLVGDKRLTKESRATIQYFVGQEMEKRDHKDPALDLYKAALKTNPTDTEIRKRLDGLTASLSSKSKYDYLLRQNMVDTDQLQKAFALSKKMNKSVEWSDTDSTVSVNPILESRSRLTMVARSASTTLTYRFRMSC